jgi:hypothetical protein
MYNHKWRPKEEPWHPHDYDEQTVYAIRALASGTANEGQQKTAWQYLMYLTAASEEFQDLSFRPGPDGERSTNFAEGKRFVGQQLRKLLRPELTPEAVVGGNNAAPLSRRAIAQRLRRNREKIRHGQSD